MNFLTWMFGPKPPPKGTPEYEKLHRISCPPQEYPENKRMHRNLGYDVHGFPSTGGMLLLTDCSRVELLYLNLPTTLPIDIDKCTNQEDEDAFSQKMRMLGATLWPGMLEWVETWFGAREREGDENVEVRVGWPSDGVGVWVIRRDGRKGLGLGLGLLGVAGDMDERCRMIEQMGGRFYEVVEGCAELVGAFGKMGGG